jgi:hypothetical protein
MNRFRFCNLYFNIWFRVLFICTLIVSAVQVPTVRAKEESVPALAVTPRCGTISNSVTWSGSGNVQLVTCDVIVGPNATLTIEAGAIVKFDDSKALLVQGALRVLGTESNSVYFTSSKDDALGGDTNGDGANTTPAAGNWIDIEFQDSSIDANSIIDSAVIRYGGGARCCWTEYGAITFLSANPTIQNTTIRDSKYYAYRADLNSFPNLANNTLINNGINGLTLTVDVYGNTINTNATWNLTTTTYFLRDQFSIGTDKMLTINPGVKVKFNNDIGLMVTGGNSALQVLGTSGNPVTFTSIHDDGVGGDTNNNGSSTLPAPGNWVEIQFGDNSNDALSLIDYAVIRYGGGARCCWTNFGAITLLSANPTIQNTTIRDSKYYAYRADLNSFPVLLNNTLTNNGINGITLTNDVYGSAINTNATWNLTNTTYFLRDQFAVGTDKTLTINAGVKVKFNNDIGLMVTGGNSALRVLGTSGNPVTFTSIHDDGVGGDTNNNGSITLPTAGNWVEIQFGDNSNDALSLIDNALIRYGGGARCCWTEFGAITLLSANPTIKNSTIRDSRYYAYRADLNSFPALINNTLINNGINGITLTSDVYGNAINTNATWNLTTTTYYLRDQFSIGTDQILTINPGVKIKLSNGIGLMVTGGNSALRVLGTNTSPVIFTSINDDTVGGDTNNNGTNTVPAPGNWVDIEFGENSNDASSLIDNALIRYGGGSRCCWTSYGAITLVGTNLTIKNSTIRDSQNYGISTNTSAPALSCVNIFDNGSLNNGKRLYGLYNQTPATGVNATNLWWGSASGPYHPSLNAGGTGNAVSEGVGFNPFRTSLCPPIDTPYKLTVSKTGTGSGTVTSSPVGINCGPDCMQDYAPGTMVTLIASEADNAVFAGWSGACTNSSGPCVVTMNANKSVTATFTAMPTNVDVFIGGVKRAGYYVPMHRSVRKSIPAVNGGPVKIINTQDMAMVASERVIYKVNNTATSYSEMMALPNSLLDTTYWLPWYNNVDLDTQLRIGNVTNATATVNIYIAGTLRTPTPITLAPGASTRQSFPGINNGPVKIVSNQKIVAAERVIYKVNGINTSFTEMMALPNSQLDTTYWLPWYNNVDLDTQLRFANVSNTTATVHVYVGNAEMTGSPFTLTPGSSTRKSFIGVNSGPVKVVSTQNMIVAERVIYKVNGINTSFSEMMGLPDSQLNTTYWLPWYNNGGDLDTQLRIANVSGTQATVFVYIGEVEMPGSPYTIPAGASIRKNFAGINNGPVEIVGSQNIVAAQRLIYKANGINTSFSEMLALPHNQQDVINWLPWYNNVDLDTQLRFGLP